MPPSRERQLGVALGIATAVLFSFHYVAAKLLLAEGARPLALSAFRGVAGGLGLLLFHARETRACISPRVVGRVGVVAFFGFYLNQIFFMNGLKLTSAPEAALIQNSTPLVSTLIAIVLGQEKAAARLWIGLWLGFGAIVGYFFLQGMGGPVASAFGGVLIFLNVLSFSISLVLARKALRDLPVGPVAGLLLLTGGTLLALSSLGELAVTWDRSVQSSKFIWLFVFEIWGSTSLAWFLNFQALKRLDVSGASYFMYLQPPLTVLFAWLTTGAELELSFFGVTALLVIAGVLVLRRNSSPGTRA